MEVKSNSDPQPAGCVNYEEHSRRELLAQYCQDPRNGQLVNEVLEYYEQEIKRAAKPVAYGMCPQRSADQEFFRATLNRARLKFIRGVCSYKGDTTQRWNAWLRKVVRTAALEELDFLVHRRWNIPITETPPESVFRDNDTPTQGNEGSWDRVFRSAYHQGVMAQPLPRPDALIEAEERKSLILKVLVLYSQRSVKTEDSATAIRLHYWDGWSVIEIAKYRFGDPVTAGKEQAIRREFSEDYDGLLGILKREFGVTSLGLI